MTDEQCINRSFRQELQQIQKQHPLFQETHPFWKDCFRRRLELADIRRWALDVYPLIRDFSRLYIHVAAHCESERTLTFLAETIYEETGSGKESESHPTLFRHFLKSLGVPEEKIEQESTTASGRALLEYSWRTVREGSFVEGLSLVGLGIERPLPAFFKMISRSFQAQLGLTESDVRFFSLHTVADVKHSQLAARIISEEARTKYDQQAVAVVLNRFWDLQTEQLNELTIANQKKNVEAPYLAAANSSSKSTISFS